MTTVLNVGAGLLGRSLEAINATDVGAAAASCAMTALAIGPTEAFG